MLIQRRYGLSLAGSGAFAHSRATFKRGGTSALLRAAIHAADCSSKQRLERSTPETPHRYECNANAGESRKETELRRVHRLVNLRQETGFVEVPLAPATCNEGAKGDIVRFKVYFLSSVTRHVFLQR